MKIKILKKIVWVTGTNGFVGKNLLSLFPKEKAGVAKKDVLVYTWDNHVRKLTTFFDNICAE